MKTKSLFLTAFTASLLSGCAILDTVNPFDKTDADIRKEQGTVAGDEERISILELSETLTIETPTAPDLIVLPDPYVNTDWPQAGGNVQHVVQHTGATGPLEKSWTKDIGEGSGRKGRVIASPVVANGTIFTLDARYNVMAIEEATGNKFWDFRVEGIERESTREGKTSFIDRIRDPLTFTDGDGTAPAPAVIDDVIIAPFTSGELIALRVQNGVVLWQDALSSTARLTPLASLNDISGGPAVADGYVIASAQSGVMTAFDLRTGQRVWSQPAGSLSIPLIVGDVVYTATTTGQVAAMSKLDGKIHWIEQLENFKNAKKRKERTVWTGPILAGNRLVVASSRGDVVLLDPRAGTILKEMDIGGSVFVPPIISNETVYILTDEAKLVALK